MDAEKQKTILIVEDEAIIAMTEKMTIEKYGYEVIIANTGEQAVALVKKTPAIDLILMDIDLGAGMDGTEAAEIILRDRNIPIVFLSSHTEAEIVARTEKITAYGFIVKNSSTTVFQALLKMVFKLFESKKNECKKESRQEPALKALRESEERFHSFFDNANAGIYRTAPDGSIHLANPALVRMLGYSSFAELREKDLNKAPFEPSYSRSQFVAKIEKHGEVQGLESVWKRKDGGSIVVRESARAIRDARGKTLYYDGIVEDVTEIKRSEMLTAALYGISQAMFASGDLDELYPRIHGLIAGIVPASNFFIALLTNDGRNLGFPYYRDEKDKDDNIFIKTDDPQSLTAEVLRTKKTLLLNEAQIQERYASGGNRVWGTAPKCWLGVPLRIGSETIGVMAIQDYNKGGAYSQSDVMLLESTAGQVAMAIARKRTEQALRESVEEFKGYFNMGAVGACVTSLDKGWIEVNDRLCGMLGYPREELLRLTWAEMTHPDDLNADLDLFNQVLAGRRDAYELEKRFIRKDGRTIHTLLYVSCQRNPDRSIHHFLASLVDISERNQAEAALQKSEMQRKAMLENSPVVILLIQEGRLVYINPAAEKTTGWQEEEFIGKIFTSFVHKDDIEIALRKNRERLDGNNLLAPYVLRIIKKTGGFIYAEINGTVIDLDGKPTMLGFLTDITERKLAEQELRESKALIEAVVENVPLMIFLKEATDLRFVIFNRAGEELLGYDRQSLLGKNNLDLFPPEQAAHFMAKDREVLDGEAGMLDIPEEAIQTAKKGQRLLHTRKVRIRGNDGISKYLLGISEDITERKKTEEQIKRQLAEKEILLKEVHHRIKNNIASIGGLLAMRLQSITNPEAIAVLQDAIGRVDSMRLLYDKMLLAEGFKDIPVKIYVESLADTVVALFPERARIQVEKRIADFHLDAKRLFPLGLIINELMTNKMKYAFIGRKSGMISISLANENGRVTLIMQDNGVGLPSGFDISASKGFGLTLVKMLSQQLGGSFSIKNDNGTRSTLEFTV